MTDTQITDRQLLELAAKAIGLELGPDSPWRTYDAKSGFQWWNDDARSCVTSWSPLTDDGDAMRLMYALQARTGRVIALSIGGDRSGCEFHWGMGGDVAANTRRAIVLAAVEIARAMP